MFYVILFLVEQNYILTPIWLASVSFFLLFYLNLYRFITRNTFEERIDAMIQQKKDLAELTVATGESWIGKLSNTELHEIFERRE